VCHRRWNSLNWAYDTGIAFCSTRSFFVLFCIVFCNNKSCTFGEDAGREEEELWFELKFVSFGFESHRPLCFCALQLLHGVHFLALLELALAVSDINRWFQEWNRAMRSLFFLWFVCTRYLFWFFSQYKFEFQAFLKFCDAAGSKFRSITKRLRLGWLRGESWSSWECIIYTPTIQVHILLHFRPLSVIDGYLFAVYVSSVQRLSVLAVIFLQDSLR